MDLQQLKSDMAENLAIERFRQLFQRLEPLVTITVSCGGCGADQLVRVQPSMRRISIVCTECRRTTMARVW